MNPEYSIETLKSKVDGNKEFWNSYLKVLLKSSSSILDRQLAPIVKEVTGRINCLECANCCNHLEPGITEEEMKALAFQKKLPEEEFRKTYTGTEDGTGILFLKKTPCTFLEGTACSVYSGRPGSCAAYPGLEWQELKYRLRRIFSQLTICPIIYYTFLTLYERHYDRKETGTPE